MFKIICYNSIYKLTLQKGIIEIDDDMFVMEPADGQNKEYSHVAHKINHKHMKFEDINGTICVHQIKI